VVDPIHPIVPITDRIPQVTGPPRVDRLKREAGYDDAERRQAREQRRKPPDADESDDEAGDDGRPHIDISA
jgi:hypothetical protein